MFAHYIALLVLFPLTYVNALQLRGFEQSQKESDRLRLSDLFKGEFVNLARSSEAVGLPERPELIGKRQKENLDATAFACYNLLALQSDISRHNSRELELRYLAAQKLKKLLTDTYMSDLVRAIQQKKGFLGLGDKIAGSALGNLDDLFVLG